MSSTLSPSILSSSSPSSSSSSQSNVSSETIDYEIASIEITYFDLTQISSIRLMFLSIYSIVMISASIGNLIIIYIIVSDRRMHTVVNHYIVNLAVCDLLISIFVLPTKVLELLAPAEWLALNDTICMIMFFLQTVVVFASVLTLVATCFERYFAIVHPLKSRMQQRKKRTRRILLAVWTMSSFASLPNLLKSPLAVINILHSEFGSISRLTCIPSFDDDFRMAYFTSLFIGLYLIPLLSIGYTCFCIARVLLRTSVLNRQGSLLRQEINRRKIGKMILIVVLCFTISWTPYFLVSVITQYQNENFMNKHNFYFTMLSINLFAFLHSSINPIIYLTMNKRFQNGFLRIVQYCCFCFRLQLPMTLIMIEHGGGGGMIKNDPTAMPDDRSNTSSRKSSSNKEMSNINNHKRDGS
ncbi:mitochondrial import receptor [Sarcoptes scabiei]|nr:mitochondrial import receptor [Sarcoptes scabiei]